MTLPVAKSLSISTDVAIVAYHVLACRTGGLYIFLFFYFFAGCVNLNLPVHSGGEAVLRLIGVDGTSGCVHLFIDNFYRLSRKEKQEEPKCTF